MVICQEQTLSETGDLRFVTTAATRPDFRRRVFLCGADMDPVVVRQRWPDARFTGIARADGIITRALGLSPYAFGSEVWGIVVDTGEEQSGAMIPLTLRDGSPATAMGTADAARFGTLKDALAQALYWELPAAYRDQLQAAIDRA
jgi:hypothetical protein